MKSFRLRIVCALALASAFAASCSRPAAVATAKADAAAPNQIATPAAPSSATAATATAASTASFKFATQTLTVPAGFTVELVAGPPLVNRPISVAFDEQGRLYATDSSGNSDRAPKQFEEKPHRIVRLEDADGDGRFEKSTVFAEKVMFPQGALFHEGSLYVAAPPHVWKFTDDNGDGVSDRREIWYDGKTLTGCGNDLHGPYLGLDGWMYWTKGASAEQHHTLPSGKPFLTRAAHIFRSRPDGTGEEPVMTGGMDNPVGVTFTSTGDRILSGTFFQIGVAGKRDGLIHAIYGGVYGKDQPSIVGHTRTGDLMPIMTHMGAAAPCGSTTYRSQVFGTDFSDNLFVCYFNLRKISRHQLVPDGASFKTIDTDFITSDSQDFRPTDVLEDADGSLLVIDTGGWYKICCPTSQLSKPDILGGIYRIRKTGAPKLADPRGLTIAWNPLNVDALIKLLADERPYVRERAMHVLGKAGETAVAAVGTAATKSPLIMARQNALWTLARIKSEGGRTAVRQALDDREPSVVRVALQVTSLLRDAAAVDRLARLATSENLPLARLAAETLGRIGDARAVDALLASAQRLGDTKFTATGTSENPAERILEHSLIYALTEIGARDPLFARLKPSEHPRVVRAALVALDQMEGGALKAEHALTWLESSVPRLKQTASWVVGQHADWGDALAHFYARRLKSNPRGTEEREELQTQLASLAKASAIHDLLIATATDAGSPVEMRLVALRAMAAAGLKETPARWLADLAALLSANDPTLTGAAVSTARTLPLPKGGHAKFSGALARAGRNENLPAEVRLDALATAAPAAIAPVDPALFDFLCAHLDPKQPMLVRSAAATVLAKVSLAPPQQLALAETMRTVGPLEAPKLLPAFEKAPNENLGVKLIAALQQSSGLRGLRANSLKPLFAKYPASVQQRAESLLTQINADVARQNSHVDELLGVATNGDIRRGQAVFNSEKTACAVCHKIGYLGGLIGPDLTNIGRIRNERELLEAIVYPSATFVRGYEPFTVKTKTGDEFTGIIKKDTAEEVVLAIGPAAEKRVARGDIVDLQPSPISPMPPGADAILTKQELADLLAFLKSRQ